MRRATTRGAVGLLVALLVVLATPLSASAHATLVGTSPGRASVVQTAPVEVRLEFSEVVEGNASDIAILAPDGSALPLSAARTDPDDRSALVVPFPRNPAPGTYEVRWRVLSIDGHPVAGVFRFAYQRATAPVGGGGTTTPTGLVTVPRLAWLGRSLSAAGVLALVGLAAFPWLVARRLSGAGTALAEPARRGIRRPALVAAAVAVIGTLLLLVATAATSSGRTPGAQLGDSTALLDFATGTRTGVLLLLRLLGIATVAGLVVLGGSRAASSRPSAWVTVGTAAAALFSLLTFGLSSHAASAPADRTIVVGFDLLHLTAASLWSGGLLGLALVGLPAARAVGRSKGQVADLAGMLTERFSLVAQIAMLAVLATGGYLALLQVDRIRDLTDSTWGTALTVKIGLWLTVLLIAGVNAVMFVPAIARHTGSLQRSSAARNDLASGIRLELMLAAALVVVAALMSATPPPSTEVAAPVPVRGRDADVRTASGVGQAVGYTARVTVSRLGGGTGAATVFRVDLTTEGTAASSPSADALLRYPDGDHRSFALHLTGPGEWLSDRLSVPSGRYLVTTRFQRSGDTVAVPVKVKVPS